MTYDGMKADAYAQQFIGFHEHPDGSNVNPWSEWQYGVHAPGGGYCCSFESACLVLGGGFNYDAEGQPRATYGAKGFSFTDALRDWAKAHGLWRDRSYRAKPGDAFIFDWNGDGRTDHIEENHYDDGVHEVLVGGNTGNGVYWRTRDRKYVAGIVAFSESKQATPPVDLHQVALILAWRGRIARKALERGDVSNDVAFLHQLLAKAGWMPLPKQMNQFGLWTHNGIAHMATALRLHDRNGDHFGIDKADALLSPKK